MRQLLNAYEGLFNATCTHCSKKINWTFNCEPTEPYWEGECCDDYYILSPEVVRICSGIIDKPGTIYEDHEWNDEENR